MSTTLSIGSPKGGTGKTTLALSLAGSYSSAGARVLVLDRDPNRAALLWAGLADRSGRELPFTVAGAVSTRDRDTYDLVILDQPPGCLDSTKVDLVIVPALLDAASVLSAEGSMETIRQQGRRGLVVANRVRHDRADERMTLTKCLPHAPWIADRAIFATAYGRGATVFDSGAGLLHAPGARREIESLRQLVDAALFPVKAVA